MDMADWPYSTQCTIARQHKAGHYLNQQEQKEQRDADTRQRVMTNILLWLAGQKGCCIGF